MKISDEIRVWCDRKCGCYIDGDVRDDLYALADRIDNRMVELPKDADGEVIHVMDTLYDVNSGSQMQVRSMTIDRSWMITTDGWCTYAPSTVTHIRPDSLERIADELDAWRVAASWDCRINAIDEDIVHDLAERIRNLAKEDEE